MIRARDGEVWLSEAALRAIYEVEQVALEHVAGQKVLRSAVADLDVARCAESTMSEQEVMTTEQAAEALGVSRQRIRLLLKNGGLKGEKRGGRSWSVSIADVNRRRARRPHGEEGEGSEVRDAG